MPKEQQEPLAKKIQKGDRLDADSSYAKPVSEHRWSDDEFEYLGLDYRDGSFKESHLQKPEAQLGANDATAQKISGCVSQTGTGYSRRQNCLISAVGATYDASFIADFTFSGGSVGTITRADQPSVKGVGGNVTNMSVRISRPKSSGQLPAEAYLTWHFNSTGDVASGTTYLYLRVTPTTATTAIR